MWWMKVQRHIKENKENECQPLICIQCFKGTYWLFGDWKLLQIAFKTHGSRTCSGNTDIFVQFYGCVNFVSFYVFYAVI